MRIRNMNSGRVYVLTVFIVVLCLASMAAGWGAAPAKAEGSPELDLAALLLHSDDLDWLVDELGSSLDGTGSPFGALFSTGFTTIEDAVAAERYAYGRGGLTLALMESGDAADVLRDAGWVRAHDEFLVLPTTMTDREWSHAFAAGIEEFETAEGAAAAFTAVNNEQDLLAMTNSYLAAPIEPDTALEGLPHAMWVLGTGRYAARHAGIVTLWAQVDNLIVSVAMFQPFGTPDPSLVVDLMQSQLKRIEHAEHLYQPHLSACTPILGGAGISTFNTEYGVLNGVAFAYQSQTYDDLEEDQAKVDQWGLADQFVVSQQIDGAEVGAYDGTMYFRGVASSFTDEEHAEDYLASAGNRLTEGYTEVEELRGVPELGDDAMAISYLGLDDHLATIVYVQIDDQVFAVRFGSTTEVVLDSVIELAEMQVEHLEDGNCGEPMELPAGL